MTGFKAILPAHGNRQSPSALGARDLSTQSPTRSENRVDDLFNMEEAKPKRKRTVQGKVATIACLECRRTRSKCDGEPPHHCARCRARGFRCVYQPHTKIQKDEILNDLEQERARTESLTQRNHELSTIVQAISNDGHVEEVRQRLQYKEDTKSIASWLNSLPDLQSVLRRNSPEFADTEEAIENLGRIYGMDLSDCTKEDLARFRWTQVTNNVLFLDHLVKLYLVHVHPRCMLFNELTFARAYRSGDEHACSRVLLNAICAMACNTLNRKCLETERDTSDLSHVQEAFLVEARSSIKPTETQDIMTVQAMAIMYLTDMSRGKARSASTYLNCASEGLRILEVESELSTDFDLSRWGIHCLEATSSALTCQHAFSPQTLNTSVTFDSGGEFLRQFANEADPLLNNSLEIHKLSIKLAGFKARLCKLIHEMTGIYGNVASHVTLDAIMTFSKTYIQLMDSTFQTIRQPGESPFGSDIRAAHIKFYSVSSNLWLPLVSLARAQQNQRMLEFCCFNLLDTARKGLNLAREVLSDPGCEFFLAQCTLCVLNVCDSVARYTNDRDEQLLAIDTCFRILDRNMVNFKLCSLLRKLFRDELAKFVHPEVIDFIQKEFAILPSITIDEALDATTRLTYVAAFPGIDQWLSDHSQWQWSTEWLSPSVSSPGGSRMSTSGTQAMRVEDMCN